MRLDELTEPSLIVPRLGGFDRPSVLRALAAILDARHGIDPAALYRRLEQREALGSTALGGGVAVPHCKMPGVDGVVLAVGIAPQGIDFGAADGQPVRLFFLVVSPERAPAAHLKCLAAISRWVQRDDDQVRRILELRDPVAIHRLLRPTPEAG